METCYDIDALSRFINEYDFVAPQRIYWLNRYLYYFLCVTWLCCIIQGLVSYYRAIKWLVRKIFPDKEKLARKAIVDRAIQRTLPEVIREFEELNEKKLDEPGNDEREGLLQESAHSSVTADRTTAARARK